MCILRKFVDVFNLSSFVTIELLKGILSFSAPSLFTIEKDLRDKTVLVTGAAGGLGRLDRPILQELILWDRDEKDFQVLNNLQVKTKVVDLSKSNEISIAASELHSIDIVINRMEQEGSILKVIEDEIRTTMEINCFSHFWLAKEVLPGMIERNNGHIVTVASCSAFSPIEYAIPYSVSKTAALAIQEALENEVSAMGKNVVKITTILPGFFISPLTEKFINDRGIKPTITAEDVAEETVKAIIYERAVAIIPKPAMC